ncbi:MAG: lysophospholipid acyltransferase family protein [Candidatus Gastranaerophilales bacterium]|nr:lysophospholipid acyltransferase family protein [Candidatus Gastranaerophilales bacterium]
MSGVQTIVEKTKEKDNPLITGIRNPFWLKVADYMFFRLMRGRFYSMRIKNAHNFELRDKSKSTIIYANHLCWWDGQVIYMLNKKFFKTEMYLMIEELERMPLLSKIGAFSVEKNSPQASMRALRYALGLLKDPQKSVHLFPQGLVLPPDYRPVKFSSGLSYLAQKSGGVNLLPIAHRYEFLREDKPEILVEVGKPIIINKNTEIDRKIFSTELAENFTNLLDKQRYEISKGQFDDYEYLFTSKLNSIKMVEKKFKVFVRAKL